MAVQLFNQWLDIWSAARADVQLEGLLSVFAVGQKASDEHWELPVLSEEDKAAIAFLAKDCEIDFLSLSFTKQAGDVMAAQKFLKSVGLGNTQVRTTCDNAI